MPARVGCLQSTAVPFVCVWPVQVGGVGAIPEAMAEGIEEHGSYVEYKANVKAS